MFDVDTSRVYVADKEPTAGRWPLLFPVEPRPGESLQGLVARSGALNIVPSLSRLLTLAGIARQLPEISKSMSAREIRDLARLIRVSDADVKTRMLRWVGPPGHREVVHGGYFGTELRADLFETRVRRVSPAALKTDSYHRGIWQLRFLCFDPGTMQLLVGECPHCHRMLGWSTALGIHICESCRADLRDVETGRVDSAFAEPCSWAARLASHDPAVRREASVQLPDPLNKLKPSQILDLMFRMDSFSCEDPSSKSRSRLSSRLNAGEWNAERLASAANFLTAWPKSFFDLCDRRRSAADKRDGYFGVEKELASLVTRTSRVPVHVAVLLRMTIDDYYGQLNCAVLRGHGKSDAPHIGKRGLASVQSISKQVGHPPKVVRRLLGLPGLIVVRNPDTKRSPILLDREQIFEWFEIRKQLVSSLRARDMTGIPEFGLIDLARRNIVRMGSGPALLIAGRGDWFYLSSVEGFMSELAPSNVSKQVTPYVTLDQFMKGCPAPKPWGAAIEAMLTNPGAVVGRLDANGKPWAQRLAVNRAALDFAMASLGPRELAPSEEIPHTTSTAAAAEYLDTNEANISGLMQAGGIDFELRHGHRRPLRASVEAFAKIYVLGAVLNRVIGPFYVTALAGVGIEPVPMKDTSQVRRHLRRYLRSDVEQYLAAPPAEWRDYRRVLTAS